MDFDVDNDPPQLPSGKVFSPDLHYPAVGFALASSGPSDVWNGDDSPWRGDAVGIINVTTMESGDKPGVQTPNLMQGIGTRRCFRGTFDGQTGCWNEPQATAFTIPAADGANFKLKIASGVVVAGNTAAQPSTGATGTVQWTDGSSVIAIGAITGGPFDSSLVNFNSGMTNVGTGTLTPGEVFASFAEGDWTAVGRTGTSYNFDGTTGTNPVSQGQFYLFHSGSWMLSSTCPQFDVSDSQWSYGFTQAPLNQFRSLSNQAERSYKGHRLHFSGFWHKGPGAEWIEASLWNLSNDTDRIKFISTYAHWRYRNLSAHFNKLGVEIFQTDVINEHFSKDFTNSMYTQAGMRSWQPTFPPAVYPKGQAITESAWHYTAASMITSWGISAPVTTPEQRIVNLWQYFFQVARHYFPNAKMGFNDYTLSAGYWDQGDNLSSSYVDLNGSTVAGTAIFTKGDDDSEKRSAMEYNYFLLRQRTVPIVLDSTLDLLEYSLSSPLGAAFQINDTLTQASSGATGKIINLGAGTAIITNTGTVPFTYSDRVLSSGGGSALFSYVVAQPDCIGLQSHLNPLLHLNLRELMFQLCRLTHMNIEPLVTELNLVSETVANDQFQPAQDDATLTVNSGSATGVVTQVAAFQPPSTTTNLFASGTTVGWQGSTNLTATAIRTAIHTNAAVSGYDADVDPSAPTKVRVRNTTGGFSLTVTVSPPGTISISSSGGSVNHHLPVTVIPPQFIGPIAGVPNFTVASYNSALRQTGYAVGRVPPTAVPELFEDDAPLYRYGSWYTESYVSAVLDYSRCSTLGIWPSDAGQDVYCFWDPTYTFRTPLYQTIINVLARRTTPPSQRTIPNAHRLSWIKFQRLWNIPFAGCNITNNSPILGAKCTTTTGNNSVSWSWYEAQGISSTDCVLVLQWYAPKPPASGTTLLSSFDSVLGSHVAISFLGTTNGLVLDVVNSGTVEVSAITVGSVNAGDMNMLSIRVSNLGITTSLNGATAVFTSIASMPSSLATINVLFDHGGLHGYTNAVAHHMDVWAGSEIANDTILAALSLPIAIESDKDPMPRWDAIPGSARPNLIPSQFGLVLGPVTMGPFLLGETINQSSSMASGVVTLPAAEGGILQVLPTKGIPFDAIGSISGVTSGAMASVTPAPAWGIPTVPPPPTVITKHGTTTSITLSFTADPTAVSSEVEVTSGGVTGPWTGPITITSGSAATISPALSGPSMWFRVRSLSAEGWGAWSSPDGPNGLPF